MVITPEVIDLSRLQFAVTALYHFLFVPLTLGMTFMLATMETVYYLTGKQVYKDMVKFWGKLFGINFALGVVTGITMEFEFGTNWAYYSHYVGDIFGAPLAIEGLTAFFLESTFIGLFFFGWDRLTKLQHLVVTYLTALGSNLSALWIIIANNWMQNPVGSEFSPVTMRMEMTDFVAVLFNPAAQSAFTHTVGAGYVTASVFVVGISSFYLLKGRDVDFAVRSIRIAAVFGLFASLSVVTMGDESGYEIGMAQKTKLAALEAMWHTEPAPASFNIVAWPNEEKQENDFAIHIPWVMGIIGTRSLDTEIPGIVDIREMNAERVRRGVQAAIALERVRKNPDDAEAESILETYKDDLGYGFLTRRYVDDYNKVTEEIILKAAHDTVPPVAPMFWAFRVMVGLGMMFVLMFALATYFVLKNTYHEQKWLQRWFLLFIPTPWIASEMGWFVTEYGRQPWTIFGILPTDMSTSSLTPFALYFSLTGFITIYTILLVIEIYLMVRFAKMGPASLGTGRYHGESGAASGGSLGVREAVPAKSVEG